MPLINTTDVLNEALKNQAFKAIYEIEVKKNLELDKRRKKKCK